MQDHIISYKLVRSLIMFFLATFGTVATAQVASQPGLSSFLDTINSDRQVVFVGVDQQVHDLDWVNNGQGWQNFDLTFLAGGPSVALLTGKTTGFFDTFTASRLVLYVGTDQHVHDLEWSNNGQGWHNFDLTTLAGGATVVSNGGLSSFSDTPLSTSRFVFYIGRDLHVYALQWSNNGQGWQNFDLIGLAGGPTVAATGISSFVDTSTATRLVLYVGSDQHVHDLEWSNNGQGWQNFDLTALTGGVVVASGGALASFMDTLNAARFVLYVGSDHHVHDLQWSNNGQGWQHFDLTALAGGPLVASSGGALTAFVDTLNPADLVLYIGSDSHVHDLEWSNNGQGWHNFDLSALAGGVSVGNVGSLTSFLDTINPARLIIFEGSDAHVHDLEWSNNGQGWHNFDIGH